MNKNNKKELDAAWRKFKRDYSHSIDAIPLKKNP